MKPTIYTNAPLFEVSKHKELGVELVQTLDEYGISVRVLRDAHDNKWANVMVGCCVGKNVCYVIRFDTPEEFVERFCDFIDTYDPDYIVENWTIGTKLADEDYENYCEDAEEIHNRLLGAQKVILTQNLVTVELSFSEIRKLKREYMQDNPKIKDVSEAVCTLLKEKLEEL